MQPPFARCLCTVHQTCFFKSFLNYITRKPQHQTLRSTSKAEPSVLFYGKDIYDGVICNTFKACITLLFISWQVSAVLSVTNLKRKNSHINWKPSLRGVWHKPVQFYFYSDSNDTRCRKEHLRKSIWKVKHAWNCHSDAFSRGLPIQLG